MKPHNNPHNIKVGDKVRTIDGLDGIVHYIDLRTSPYIIYVDVGNIKAYLGWQLEIK